MRLFVIAAFIFIGLFVQDCRNNELTSISFGISENIRIAGNLKKDLSENDLEIFKKFCSPGNQQAVLNKVIEFDSQVFIGMVLSSSSEKYFKAYLNDASYIIHDSVSKLIKETKTYSLFGEKNDLFFYSFIYSPESLSSVYCLTIIDKSKKVIKDFYDSGFFPNRIQRFTK